MKKRKVRKMRCPNCASFETVKNGRRAITLINLENKSKGYVNRYNCKSCGKSFSQRRDKKKRYGMAFKKELARMHLEERMSYRVISKRLREKAGIRINKNSICRMVNEIASKSKSSLQIKTEYKPKWDGYLIVDDKYVHVKKKRVLSLVAKDKSGDIVHYEMIEEDNQSGYDNFFLFIKDRLEYPFKSVTTDLDEMLEKAIMHILPEKVIHQKCIRHALEAVRRMTGYYSKKSKYNTLSKRIDYLKESLPDRKSSYKKTDSVINELIEEKNILEKELEKLKVMIQQIKQMSYQKDPKQSRIELQKFKRKYSKAYPAVVKFLKKHFNKLVSHQSDIKIPKTSNDAENLNRQIERRLKTIESFQYFKTAYDYLIMLCNYLRFKPYTDCKKKNKYRNGKSPISLCGVKILDRDWLNNTVNFR